MLIRADAVKIPLGDKTVQAVVTSPPYLAQRLYGLDPREGGQERTLDAFVQWVADVFDEARRVLRDDGLAWLNLGDKSNGSGGGGGDWRPRGTGPKSEMERRWKDRAEKLGGPRMFRDPAFDSACFLDVGGAVVHELILRGWRLRCEVIWDKGIQERASLDYVRRPRWQHEKIYALAPRSRNVARTRFYPSLMKETGSVWRFPPGGSGPSHLAPFPDELARRCILPSTLPGDLVLDPFDGSGTTRRVAEEHGRIGVGLDLYAGTESHSTLLSTRARPSTANPQPRPEIEGVG